MINPVIHLNHWYTLKMLCNTRFILMLDLEQQMKLVYVCQFSNNRALKISMQFLNILDVLFLFLLYFVERKRKFNLLVSWLSVGGTISNSPSFSSWISAICIIPCNIIRGTWQSRCQDCIGPHPMLRHVCRSYMLYVNVQSDTFTRWLAK